MGKLMDQINAVLRDTQLELGFNPPMCAAIDGVGNGPLFYSTSIGGRGAGSGCGLGSGGYGAPNDFRYACGYGTWVGDPYGGGHSYASYSKYRR